MVSKKILAGSVHSVLPNDLLQKLTTDKQALDRWHDITTLARNEWLCWVESAKLVETRKRRVERVISELKEGIRRPCCWPGCIHRERNGKS